MAGQLTFDLPVKASRDRGDFFVSEANELAVARLDDPASWPDGKLVLVGPPGSGKSHLAAIWAEEHGTWPERPVDLVMSIIPKIDGARVIEIDGPMTSDEEEMLFHLHNHMVAHGLPLLLVAREAPSRWPLTLPDLKSRMEATDVVGIGPPDDALLAAVLVKLFADRQLQVPPAVIEWLTTRMDRSFAEAQELVRLLDETALSERRNITQKLARQVLDNRRS